uniref:Uncharacterized protein n=1 Tax=Oryzias latipes TaxID=8090 RepID=A0A3B3HL09_ORYLA
MKSLENSESKIQDLSKTISGDFKQKMAILKNKMEQTIQLDVIKQRDGSESKKLGEVMKLAENDLTTEKDKMDNANIELQRKTEAANTLMEDMQRERLELQQLKVHVDSQRKRLDVVLDSVVTQQSERASKEEEIQRQAEELEIRLKQVQTEREELNAVNDRTNKMKEEVDAAMMDLLREKEEVNQMRVAIENERQRTQTEKDRIESEKSELKVREQQLLDRMKSLENIESKIQDLSKTISGDFKEKMAILKNKMEQTIQLGSDLDETVKSIEELKRNMSLYREDFEIQKEALKNAMSDEEVNQMRVAIENERERSQTEKDRIESEKSELKVREQQLLDRMKSLENSESKIQDLRKTISGDFKQKMAILKNKMEQTIQLGSDLEKRSNPLKN